jgi:hypothetical protein
MHLLDKMNENLFLNLKAKRKDFKKNYTYYIY